jgi:hypothetical protein
MMPLLPKFPYFTAEVSSKSMLNLLDNSDSDISLKRHRYSRREHAKDEFPFSYPYIKKV